MSFRYDCGQPMQTENRDVWINLIYFSLVPGGAVLSGGGTNARWKGSARRLNPTHQGSASQCPPATHRGGGGEYPGLESGKSRFRKKCNCKTV
jgi:hypothetical protein